METKLIGQPAIEASPGDAVSERTPISVLERTLTAATGKGGAQELGSYDCQRGGWEEEEAAGSTSRVQATLKLGSKLSVMEYKYCDIVNNLLNLKDVKHRNRRHTLASRGQARETQEDVSS